MTLHVSRSRPYLLLKNEPLKHTVWPNSQFNVITLDTRLMPMLIRIQCKLMNICESLCEWHILFALT